MAFGMQVTSGQFLPIVKYDSRAGKFFKVDKRADGGSDTVEIPPGTKFAVDLGTFEAGFVNFGPQGPVRHMVPYSVGVAIPAQPQDKDAEGKLLFRPGFWCKIAGNALDGVREWCSNAAVLLTAMDEFWNEAVRAPEAAVGKIPIIAITGTIPVKSGSGARSSTNYQAIIQIQAWTDRPDVLGPRTVPPPGMTNGTAQAAQTQAAQQPAAPVATAPVESAAKPASMPF